MMMMMMITLTYFTYFIDQFDLKPYMFLMVLNLQEIIMRFKVCRY